tara:strand:- start:1191 stop:2300 length:1110 start_codon:yes stop_codon:yes gene_type:complete
MKNNLLDNINQTLLMGPGPSSVSPKVYSALNRHTIGHLDPKFIEIMDHIKIMLRELLKTNNELTLPISGTGSAAMESCFVNLIEPENKILIIENGYFGLRMIDMATRLGADVTTLNFDWGKPINIDELSNIINNTKFDIVAVVHAETSTGVLNPVEAISKLIPEDTLFIVDAVTSFGTVDIEVDKWNIDAIYSCSQKGLSCPPGASPVSFSNNAINKLKNRSTKVPNWYLDLSMIINYWDGNARVYHHTAPINMMYALYQGLLNVMEEGHDNVVNRHFEAYDYLKNQLSTLNIDYLVQEAHRIPSLSSVIIPESVNDLEVRSNLLNNYNIEIGGGLGPLAGKVWRIGLMGHTAYKENVDRLIHALSEIL